MQSGHLTISFNLSIFFGFSSTTGSSTTGSSTIGSTDSLTILTFGLALDFAFGFVLGLISSLTS